MKPPKLGSVWVARARLFGRTNQEIGLCMDTPNAIAKAFTECSEAAFVKPYGEPLLPRQYFHDRMNKYNEAKSFLVLYKNANQC